MPKPYRSDLTDPWDILRQNRDVKLDNSDWTQVNDSPLTSQKKYEWASYRQALRDMPDNTSDPNNPDWPEEPS